MNVTDNITYIDNALISPFTMTDKTDGVRYLSMPFTWSKVFVFAFYWSKVFIFDFYWSKVFIFDLLM